MILKSKFQNPLCVRGFWLVISKPARAHAPPPPNVSPKSHGCTMSFERNFQNPHDAWVFVWWVNPKIRNRDFEMAIQNPRVQMGFLGFAGKNHEAVRGVMTKKNSVRVCYLAIAGKNPWTHAGFEMFWIGKKKPWCHAGFEMPTGKLHTSKYFKMWYGNKSWLISKIYNNQS